MLTLCLPTCAAEHRHTGRDPFAAPPWHMGHLFPWTEMRGLAIPGYGPCLHRPDPARSTTAHLLAPPEASILAVFWPRLKELV